MSKLSDSIRKQFGDGDRERDKDQKTPDNVIRYDDICYGDDSEWNVLDVYRPRQAGDTEKLPVIVNVHGGAWMYGDKGVYQYYCMSLAGRGFAVVNFTYRLAPEFKYPAQVEDIDSVMHWITENCDKYGLDTDNVFAVGDSAGAHLLGIYSSAYGDPSFAKEYAIDPPKEIVLRGVALNCGRYDMFVVEGEDFNLPELIKEIFPEHGTKKELERADVLTHVTDKFPPAIVMTCEGDFLRSHGLKMVQTLTDHGITCRYLYYGKDKNPLWHVFHCDMRLKEAAACNDAECDFFKTLISKES